MIVSPLLDRLPVRHGFFTREGGRSRDLYASLNCGLGTDDAPANVAANRGAAMVRLALPPASLRTVHQVHGTAVATADGPWPRTPPRADAVVTRTPGVAVAVLTADCAPVLLADGHARVVAAVHCGWKGTLAGVIESALDAMIALGARPATIAAAIGPCIAQASYEVGPDLRQAFSDGDAASARFFTTGRADRHQFDLGGYVEERLRRRGVATIDRLAHDTYADDARFFSFRRATHRGEADYGRQLSAIALA
jgi:YfiH family protein